MSKIIAIIAVVIILFAALGVTSVFWVQSSQNKAIAYEEQVKQSWSKIDVYQKRRTDLLYELADAVKEYDKHEAQVFIETIKARGGAMTTRDVKLALGAVHEQYPQLQSQKNYQNIMTEMAMSENKLAQVRDSYNTSITEYSRYIRKFPTRIFLDMCGYVAVNFDYLKYDSSPDAPKNLFGNMKD